MTRPSEKARLRVQTRLAHQAQARARARRQMLAMPVLVTGFVGAMAVTGGQAVQAHGSEVPASDLQKVAFTYAPAVTISKKPVPVAKRWVAPVSGYRLTARFGASSGLWSHSHTGIDLAAPTGTPIRSVTAGEVVSTGYDGAYGNKTVIRYEDGTEIWYCHQTTMRVSAGQKVLPGQVIGSVGSTGNVTGPHLHLEVRPSVDTPVDPYGVLAKHGVRL